MPDFRYMNTQQKIEHYEGIVGACRENFMNDEAYLTKLVDLAENKPKAKPVLTPKKPLFKKKK